MTKSLPQLTQEECEELMGAIDSEGFDYYFNDYGPDERLEKRVGKEISDYKAAKQKLEAALRVIGIDMDNY